MEFFYRQLIDDNLAYIVHKDGRILARGRGKGILPLYSLHAEGGDFSGCALTDRAVGLAAAHLCAAMDFASVYAGVLSRGAQELLSARGIRCEGRQTADYILNGSRTDLCPLERTFLDDGGKTDALMLIAHFIEHMKTGGAL